MDKTRFRRAREPGRPLRGGARRGAGPRRGPGHERRERIDPDAEEVLRAMSKYMGSLPAYSAKAEVDTEVIDMSGQKLQLATSGSFVLSRPGQLLLAASHAVRKLRALHRRQDRDDLLQVAGRLLPDRGARCRSTTPSPPWAKRPVSSSPAPTCCTPTPSPVFITDVTSGTYIGTTCGERSRVSSPGVPGGEGRLADLGADRRQAPSHEVRHHDEVDDRRRRSSRCCSGTGTPSRRSRPAGSTSRRRRAPNGSRRFGSPGPVKSRSERRNHEREKSLRRALLVAALLGASLIVDARAPRRGVGVGAPGRPVAGVARRTTRRMIRRTTIFVATLPPSCTTVVVEDAPCTSAAGPTISRPARSTSSSTSTERPGPARRDP